MTGSELPSFDDEFVARSMEIRRVVITKQPCSTVLTTIRISDTEPASFSNVEALLYTVTDESTVGFLPSKAWFDASDDLVMSFYCSASLPVASRPFGNGPMYVLTVPVPSNRSVIDYDSETRVFIDQQLDCSRNMWYIFAFGPAEYSRIVI